MAFARSGARASRATARAWCLGRRTGRSSCRSPTSIRPRPIAAPLRTTIHSPSLGWCGPSRDATWLACTTRTGHEDIVLLRSDGSETRRLTDDSAKDRIPVWSPDDRTLAFMSSRTGRWELWAIGADGSGLRQLTDLQADLAWGAWSPDGKRIAVASTSLAPYGFWFLDASRTSTRDTALFVPTDKAFGADSWSSDGALLAGTETDPRETRPR